MLLLQVLTREIGRFTADHLSLDPESKWPLLMVARLKEAQARLGLCEPGVAEQLLEEVGGIYRRLMDIDPMRKGYYQDAADGRAFVVVQALGSV
jgi:geranylgeranyl transferase type-2 subunit alpha